MVANNVEYYLRKAKESIKDEKDWHPGPGPGNCNPRRCGLEALANVPGIPADLTFTGYCYLHDVSVGLGFADPNHLNNTTNHETVLKMYDLAITQASHADNG